MKRVKVYGTLGPACADENTLVRMLREGMTGMRLNLSHTSLDEASELVGAYRNAARACGIEAELLIDMQGPELRIGVLKTPMILERGARVSLDDIPFPDEVRDAANDSPPGQEALLDDGRLLLVKTSSDAFTVERGGLLESRKSVALPGAGIRTPAVTDADRANYKMARTYGVTAVMQPFVRGGEDLMEVREAMDEAGLTETRLMAKIENAEGIRTLDEIIPCCGEVVIARGDLGNSMDLWELPAAQKRIAAACVKAGRDFTVVTQMLDSMIKKPVPTRAEVSDIFNAVLDGAASVMLTGETAVGENPVEAIRYMVKTVRSAERFISE